MLTPGQAYEFSLLVLCVWREARGESMDAKHGVAWTIKNRATKGSWWGTSISQVILKPYQFSSFNGPDKAGHVDPNATKFPVPGSDPSFEDCLSASKHVYEDTIGDLTGGATHYYDDSIAAPGWTVGATKTVKLGRLNFYKDVK